jgi:hypothetical protein
MGHALYMACRCALLLTCFKWPCCAHPAAWHLPHSPSAAHAAALDAPWSGGGAGGGGDSCQGDEPDLLSSFFKPGIELIADEGSGQTVSAGGAGAGMSAGGAAVHGAGSGARVVALEAEVATLRARLESEHALRLRLQQVCVTYRAVQAYLSHGCKST